MEQRWGLPLIAWPSRLRPNYWDLVALPLVLGLIALVCWGGMAMGAHYQIGDALPISLDPWKLPQYALRTVLRMGAALVASLLFSLAYAALAAKSRSAEKILIPVLDILQSVPILGFLSITVTGFIALFPGRLLGVECAAIFAIFTSQAWNMTFSLYQSLRTVPGELVEAARMYHLSTWQRFWRLEVPHGIPALVWNMMMSVSGGWFFVVASEAITVSGQTIMLPGIGSYIATAIQQRNLGAIGYAVLVMLVVIILYDQLLFRPLLAWSQKFKDTLGDDEDNVRPWFLMVMQRAQLFDLVQAGVLGLNRGVDNIFTVLGRARKLRRWTARPREAVPAPNWIERAFDIVLLLATLTLIVWLVRFILATVTPGEIGWTFVLGAITATRVLVLIAVASLIWVPIGVWIGLHPRVADRAQPIVQFLAAFPANLFFPAAVVLILRFSLNPEIWLAPLMILGTQWYILFNVIGGTISLPTELRLAASNLGVRNWLWWRRVMLPAIFPAYVTGAVTAAGGSWNASIVSEVVQWGSTTLTATGLGAYIARYTAEGDAARITLGIGVLCLYVLAFNRLLWRRLYNMAAERLRLD
ncbi:MAG TPA: ABC transporter permease subunit [Stellaceae bacterium]|jgi:NitT/TauT family transport system permease protein|nr:ABC transporter permease subunit [Stellaceae bacterium]